MNCLLEMASSSDAHTRLTCFPCAGGTAFAFAPWAGLLPVGIALRAIEYPGHGARADTPAAASVEELAGEAAVALQRAHAPADVLLGYSFGALVAFATARLMEEKGRAPALLIVAAAPPPRDWLVVGEGAVLSDDTIRERIRRTGTVPPALLDDAGFDAHVVPLLRQDWSMSARYAPGNITIATPIIAYGGLADENVGREALARWAERTRGSHAVRMLPGGHDFVERSRAVMVDVVARDILFQR